VIEYALAVMIHDFKGLVKRAVVLVRLPSQERVAEFRKNSAV